MTPYELRERRRWRESFDVEGAARFWQEECRRDIADVDLETHNTNIAAMAELGRAESEAESKRLDVERARHRRIIERQEKWANVRRWGLRAVCVTVGWQTALFWLHHHA